MVFCDSKFTGANGRWKFRVVVEESGTFSSQGSVSTESIWNWYKNQWEIKQISRVACTPTSKDLLGSIIPLDPGPCDGKARKVPSSWGNAA